MEGVDRIKEVRKRHYEQTFNTIQEEGEENIEILMKEEDDESEEHNV